MGVGTVKQARPRLILRPGKDKALRRLHPWIFSGAIREIEGDPEPGALVDVLSHDRAWLAVAEYNPASKIRARAFCWQQDAQVDEAFWRRRLAASIARRRLLLPAVEACRLVFAEADGLPGLVVDRYGPYLVLQALTAGAERRKAMTVAHLRELLQPACILERNDPIRAREGLPPVDGALWGQAPAEPVIITEHGHRFYVDLRAGQKTGFYLDQAENRRLVGEYCRGAEVLNAFSYTGSFAVYALAGGARHVVNLDGSAAALELAARNLELNGFDRGTWQNLEADVFRQLRVWRDEGRRFDLIVLDPPKFAASRSQIQRAARGYKDINWLAIRLLRPGGLLATFSCSGLIDRDLFQKIVFGAALDAGREVRIIRHFSQSPDHPVLLTFPESAYLKGFLCHVE
ncbi:MAG: 23S rRNA (cytosine(1962)-C(5))-methyltransferase RlmI [Caldilineae bacterium]|nr:MAG: 23S rRNA (cytosine(1962)-C(5))-methyltransferase RlmI [Caldilineae bacterium]